ncbi:unnamed protein product [Bursaphelenchus xylophilus]|uniref:(pine wood nematode) hypothetical protein n=1 Tax=Bursaphelenchus xylophilus TaxID=6326 RepID=A0A1I7STF4_BURXY|nr:unnamed protein product [Bursaphelenchus xylophilus]CAG9108473.1 unnamed protein product [Bursaphelenchus xylophilus]
MDTIEREYVRNVYSRLASHASQNFFESAHQRSWPRVSEFIRKLETGSLILDIGCGPNKYRTSRHFVIGVDNCPEVLIRSNDGRSRDVVIADASNLPFRRDIADSALCISVLHHLCKVKRRKECLAELGRVMKRNGLLLIYVWAFEQPNGTFPSQDILVPWNMHEIPHAGCLPIIKFHKDSTKEQRIIANSIPVRLHENDYSQFFSTILKFLNHKMSRMKRELPPAIPHFLFSQTSRLLSGINSWSPTLNRKLRALRGATIPTYAEELANQILEDGIVEAMSTLRKVIFYRYYHVFKRGELENLVESDKTIGFFVLKSEYESANWALLLRKE